MIRRKDVKIENPIHWMCPWCGTANRTPPVVVCRECRAQLRCEAHISTGALAEYGRKKSYAEQREQEAE